MVGDDTTALQCVLNSDMERTQLLEEEARLLALQVIYNQLLISNPSHVFFQELYIAYSLGVEYAFPIVIVLC